jgi:Tfp pilus assembly protein PilN
MKPLVNLAREPFRNRRLFWLIIVIIFVVSSAVGLRAIQAITDLDRKIEALQPQVKAVEDRANDRAKPGPGEAALTLEQNHALQAANTLIARKAFSWSQLLNDLEHHVPETVRVTKISMNKIGQRTRTAANDQGGKTASLTLTGVAKNIGAISQIVKNLSSSGIFDAEPKSYGPLEGTEEYEFTLEVEYRPTAQPRPSRAGLANQVAEGGR